MDTSRSDGVDASRGGTSAAAGLAESTLPVMIYDGDCHFCSRWVERWGEVTGDKVEYVAASEGHVRFPAIPEADLANSVQFVEADGRRYQRAEAVFRAMALGGRIGRLGLAAYERVPGVAAVCDFGYRVVARNRMVFSTLTRWLWGDDVRRPTYVIGTDLVLRAIGAVYLIAFVSFASQAAGLVGERGILPAGEFLNMVRAVVGADAYWRAPTVFWFGAGNGALLGVCWVGAALAAWIVAGLPGRPLGFLLLWVGYLSLVVVGQVFYSFQWDVLLLEAGLLAVLVSLGERRAVGRRVGAHPFARLLVVWLVFRVMFSSGVVKLVSGDEAWLSLTALDYHYWTQPIPNMVAWFAAKLPGWVQMGSVGGMFAIEMVAPFLIFGPRRLRMAGFWALLALQGGIALTGNYGFFNLLSAALCLVLVDDATFARWGLRRVGAGAGRPVGARWRGWIVWPVGAALFALSVVPTAGIFRRELPIPEALLQAYDVAAPFRSVNSYGLFAVMTTDRPEIIVQGSADGVHWEDYVFKFKPGPLDRMPPFLGPFMPRLDWQMWFAALGTPQGNPWFVRFLGRLSEGEEDVIDLLADDPFAGRQPRYLRALLDNYEFTTWDEWRATGDWWQAEPRAVYFE